ncbi:MAG: DUF438 domain-containing protein [Thermoplasmata archaeon]|nr:DUF438 domain-containing protein [Thermoplasmata archaeon]
MNIDGNTKIGELIEKYPFLLDHLTEISPNYSKLKDPEMMQQMGQIATLDMVAQMGGIELHDLIQALAAQIEKVTGEKMEGDISLKAGSDEKLQALKSIITDLHSGKSVEDVKQRFLDLATEVDSSEIARMEQELIEEGLPQEEIKKLCDVHVEVFKESLEGQDKLDVPPGHPLHTFVKENGVLDGYLDVISNIMSGIGKEGEISLEDRGTLMNFMEYVGKVNLHYLRKENQLFPYLERYQVSGPSQVMWALHDDIRGMVKDANASIEAGGLKQIWDNLDIMIRTMKDMIYKEEKVLFPVSLEKLTDEDWGAVRSGEGEIGFAWVEPEEGFEGTVTKDEVPEGKEVRLDEGHLSLEQLNFMLRTLPLDISFVDENERVKYYSATEERIFPRSPAVIGREVKHCHPPKSVHVVQKILDEFKAGNKDVAEFWIQLGGKFVQIRYFAVRNGEGKFLGTLEVSQDITEIKKLEGNQRLLDWDGMKE